jgi:hypothetical protein
MPGLMTHSRDRVAKDAPHAADLRDDSGRARRPLKTRHRDVDATTGLATAWNPTRSRGHGAQDVYLDSAGNLWVSSDDPAGVTACGGHYHPGICEFPHP